MEYDQIGHVFIFIKMQLLAPTFSLHQLANNQEWSSPWGLRMRAENGRAAEQPTWGSDISSYECLGWLLEGKHELQEIVVGIPMLQQLCMYPNYYRDVFSSNKHQLEIWEDGRLLFKYALEYGQYPDKPW